MDKQQIKQIKNKLYEAEGLLELLQLRLDKQDELLPMIQARVANVAQLLVSYSEPADEHVDADVPTPTDKEELAVEATEPEEQLSPVKPFTPVEQLSPVEDYSMPNDPADQKISADIDMDYELEFIDDDEEEVDDQPVQRMQPAPTSDKPKMRPALCLNDRFRFRNALFDGNNEKLNSVLDVIASLRGFEEAEEYVYGGLGFEPDDEVVADFMEIIKSYFD